MKKTKAYFRKERNILDAKDVSILTMINHSCINFIYGFLAGAIPSAIALKNAGAIIGASLLYYFMLSIIINRPKYETKLGKFILFPVSSALGLYTGYYIMNLL